jgi:hypothetical protein
MSTGSSPCANNSLFISLLLSHFTENKYFHGNMRTYKIGGAPLAYRPRVSSAVGDPSKIHIAIKRELSMFSEYERKKHTHKIFVIFRAFFHHFLK